MERMGLAVGNDEDSVAPLPALGQMLNEPVFRQLAWLSKQELDTRILQNPVSPVSPLFRYCLARQYGYSRVADLLTAQAMGQFYEYADQYVVVWRKWLPANMVMYNLENTTAF